MSELIRKQTEQVAFAIQQQADQAQEAMEATGKAVVDQIASQAMAQAHANAAAAVAIYAAEVLQSMAGCAGNDLEAIDTMLPTSTVDAHVIDLQPVPIALPAGAKASLPQSVRMANALPEASKPTASAKRRARRVKTSEVQQG